MNDSPSNASVNADARRIFDRAVRAVLPNGAVRRALGEMRIDAPVTIFAIGKAAWTMAHAAYDALGGALVRGGVVLTKDGHAQGAIGCLEIYEAGHPVPDARGVRATQRILALAAQLGQGDRALVLLSGGGSALLEAPANGVTLDDIADITRALLFGGADIHEINCVRKRLSRVKGGRLAGVIAPARIDAILLSDVPGDALDVIASGPITPDESTCADARAVIDKYAVPLSPAADAALRAETPKTLPQARIRVAGNVDALCRAAAREAERLGYPARIMSTRVRSQARDFGLDMALQARSAPSPCALIWGGETVVNVRGNGRGGRNQEVALSAAVGIDGLQNVCVLAGGSDGTDGPTDAAGGVTDGAFAARVGVDTILRHLDNNDAYPLLLREGALLMTGPTGTNVNDLYMVLKR